MSNLTNEKTNDTITNAEFEHIMLRIYTLNANIRAASAFFTDGEIEEGKKYIEKSKNSSSMLVDYVNKLKDEQS